MTQRVFLSYSHKDEKWKEQLATHLGVLATQHGIDIWDDRRIKAGENWEGEIEDALSRARVAILLVSADFLNSEFVARREIPQILLMNQQKGLKIFPIIVRHCPWQVVPWLSRLQIRPRGAQPLSTLSENDAEAALSNVAVEVHRLVFKDQAPAPSTSTPFPAIPFQGEAESQTSRKPKRPCSRKTWIVRAGDFESIELNVSRGDSIQGTIFEEDGYPFDFYIIDARDADGPSGRYASDNPAGEGGAHYDIYWRVPRKGPWFLILDARGKQLDRDIRVDLKFV